MNFLRHNMYQDNSANEASMQHTVITNGVNYDKHRTVHLEDLNGDLRAVYILEAAHGPEWWLGFEDGGPDQDIISALDGGIKQKIRDKEIMLVIVAADTKFDPTLTEDHLDVIYKAMADYELPAGSVLIFTESNDLEIYNRYVKNNGRMIQMVTGSIRDNFKEVREEPSVEKAMSLQFSRDFNSLNKSTMHNPHVAYHCYNILKNNFLKRGLVSLNYFVDERNGENPSVIHAYFPPIKEQAWDELMPKHFPRHVDFMPDENHFKPDDFVIPYDVFDASLLTVVNETNIDDPVVISEKVFKPIRAGHPFLYIGAAGALAKLNQLGYTTDFLDIDTSYDDIEENRERVLAANAELVKWVYRPRAEKIELIQAAMPELKRNMQIQPMHDRLLTETTKQARKYFK